MVTFNRLIIVLCLWQLVSCAKLNITSLPSFTITDTVNHPAGMKRELFILHHYSGSKKHRAFIDSFARQQHEKYPGFALHQLMFYKRSSKTNERELARDYKIIDRYSQNHDWVFSYEWDSDHFYKMEIRKGAPVGAEKIIIQDL